MYKIGASAADVKKAYHKKALEYHPDRNPDKNDAQQKMALIAEANAVLTDDPTRKVYDQWGSKVGCKINNKQHIYRLIIFRVFWLVKTLKIWKESMVLQCLC